MNIDTLQRSSPALLVDLATGTVLDAPPQVVVSRRWVEAHPAICFTNAGKMVLAGPDATLAADNLSNHGDYVKYAVTREVAGFLHMERIA